MAMWARGLQPAFDHAKADTSLEPHGRRRLPPVPRRLIGLRILQIKVAAMLIRRINRFAFGRSLMVACRRTRPGRAIFNAVLGFHQSFQTLAEAEEAVRPYNNRGHENPQNIDLHLALNQSARPSDYAAMFYIASHLDQVRTVFDLGGNVGNLFYCYKRYLAFRDDLVWTVYDLPVVTQRGQTLADAKSIASLRFTSDLMEADDADLLIASGSLHYFDGLLPRLLETLPRRPRGILINRTPLTDEHPMAVIQEAGSYRMACLLQNRNDLIRSMAAFGYGLSDSWQAPELSLHVPASPAHDISSYSGLYFRLQEPPARMPDNHADGPCCE